MYLEHPTNRTKPILTFIHFIGVHLVLSPFSDHQRCLKKHFHFIIYSVFFLHLDSIFSLPISQSERFFCISFLGGCQLRGKATNNGPKWQVIYHIQPFLVVYSWQCTRTNERTNEIKDKNLMFFIVRPDQPDLNLSKSSEDGMGYYSPGNRHTYLPTV